MKKTDIDDQASGASPQLAQAFKAEARAKPEPQSSPGSEALAEELLNLIAELYCTKATDRVVTRPQLYLSSEKKWGPYQVAALPYAERTNMEATTETAETGEWSDTWIDSGTMEVVTEFDRDIFDGLREMTSAMSLVAPHYTEFTQVDDVMMFYFRGIEQLVQTCSNLLNSEDCPGSKLDKKHMRDAIPLLIQAIEQEKAYDGNPIPNYRWDMH